MANQTAREDRILEYVKAEIGKRGYPPTVREICAALGIRSTSTVHKAMESLVERGLITKAEGKRRAIQISEDQRAAVKEVSTERIDVVDIPVVGRIAAGQPILAEQNIEEYFPVPARLTGKGTSLLLNVHGDSMIEAGIFDGDYILVEQRSDAVNGEIVVAMVDGFESEATVKTFYKEQGHIRLQPENSSMRPMIVNGVKILGKVKGVFRYFH
jgi:repressor LexA